MYIEEVELPLPHDDIAMSRDTLQPRNGQDTQDASMCSLPDWVSFQNSQQPLYSKRLLRFKGLHCWHGTLKMAPDISKSNVIGAFNGGSAAMNKKGKSW